MVVIPEKHCAVNFHRFVAQRHTTHRWEAQNSEIHFDRPSQLELDEIQ